MKNMLVIVSNFAKYMKHYDVKSKMKSWKLTNNWPQRRDQKMAETIAKTSQWLF